MGAASNLETDSASSVSLCGMGVQSTCFRIRHAGFLVSFLADWCTMSRINASAVVVSPTASEQRHFSFR